MSLKILVLEGITDRGMEVLKAEGWTVDVRKAMPPAELASVVAPYQALMIRSGCQITEVRERLTQRDILKRRQGSHGERAGNEELHEFVEEDRLAKHEWSS